MYPRESYLTTYLNTPDQYDITELLLNADLNTITLTLGANTHICIPKSPLKGQIGAVFQTHCRVCVLLIIGYSTVTVKCRTAIKTLFLYFNLCQCVTLNILL